MCTNLFIFNAEVPLVLYRDDSPPADGEKRKFYRGYRLREDSRSNKKANPKVEIHDLLRKHFTNGIWKIILYLCFRDLASSCNVHTSAPSKDEKVCTFGILQQCSQPYCKKTHIKATYEEAKHMVNILNKAIKNPD